MSEAITDYEVQIKARNGRIAGRIRAAGFSSLAAFCKAKNLSKYYTRLCELISMHRPAVDKTGVWLPAVTALARALEVPPDKLFTDRQLLGGIKSTVTRHVDEDEFVWIDGPEARALITDETSQEEAVIQREIIGKYLNQLPPREKRVIEARFGLNGAPEMSTEDLAREFGVSMSRIQQIEAKALRRGKSGLTGQTLRSAFYPDCYVGELTAEEVVRRSADVREREREKARAQVARWFAVDDQWNNTPRDLLARWRAAEPGSAAREYCISALIARLKKSNTTELKDARAVD